ncbi:MAG TPA: DUF2892 domain-containing protein [Puia sp.]|nr:DUF2892 domain-containing protein [Puia sp.]
MKKNIHPVDRIVRLLFAVLVGVLYITNVISGTTAVILGAAAIIIGATALISFCPIYYFLGISTKKIKNETRN